MRYFSEFRSEWRGLTAALLGLGTGFAMTQYITSIMGPHMIAELGWSKAQFASVTALSLIMVIAIPFAGRLADVIGVRRTAAIGVIALPLCCIALSQMTGPFWQYVVLFLIQAMLCVTTTATVFTRVVVERFRQARGFALAIAASAPAVTGAIGTPLLNQFVTDHGWRAGYQAVALFCFVGGVIALLMLPSSRKTAAEATRSARRARDDYPMILRHPAFWVLAVALFLCNLPQVVALSQVAIVLNENGVSGAQLSGMLAALPIGTLVGRFAAGFALDRFPGHIVSAVVLTVPCIGLFLLASDIDTSFALTLSVFLFGLLLGAEGDLIGFMVARIFGVSIFSSIMGLVTAAIATAASTGAFLLGAILARTDSFVPFLNITGCAVAIGGLMFLLLGRYSKDPAVESDDMLDAEARPAIPA